MKPTSNTFLVCLISCAFISASPPGNAQTPPTPTCVAPDSDSDGDGWGWENEQSCRVALLSIVNTGSNSNTVSNNTSSNNTGDNPPVCALPDSDLDNDGWGWENNRSCRVVADTSGSESNSDTDNQNSGENDSAASTGSAGIHPACISRDSDPDGDGFGWENNASCRVLPISATLETTVNETTDTVPGDIADTAPAITPDTAANDTPVLIMPVGDSITHGTGGQSSYREPLNNLFIQEECSFTFVGSQTTNNRHDGFVSPHEGYSGHNADHFLNGLSNGAGDNRGISDSMARFAPDVVLLHLGTNDSRRGQNVNQTVAELDQIIATILLHNESATVLLANVIPWYRDEATQIAVETLGDRIEEYAAQLDNPQVHLVDVRSGYSVNLMIDDLVHPNADGDAHIADAFFSVFDDAGLCL